MQQAEIEQLIRNFNEIVQKKICISFAFACAEKCLISFEQFYPDDKRLHRIIETAKEWLQNPTKENKKAFRNATDMRSILRLAPVSNIIAHGTAYSVANAANAANASNVDTVVNYTSYAAAYSAYTTDRDSEILWQRAKLKEIINNYKKSQINALIDVKNNKIVGDLHPEMLRLLYEYL